MVSALDGRYWVRHAWLTCSGTWAAPGTGYPSWIVQGANPALVEEVPVQAPWSFGPVNAPDPNAPSYADSVQIGYNWAKDWFFANPARTFGLGGYSQGAECAAKLRQALSPGGELETFAPNYIGGFTLGNPRRLAGHTGGGAPDPGGAGISTTLMAPADVDANWWDEANGPANGAPGPDMYTATPLNLAGAIIRTFYSMATNIGLGHPDVMLMAIAKGVLELFMEVAGINPTTATASTPSTGILGVLSNLIAPAGTGGSILGVFSGLTAAALPAVSGPLAVLGPLGALAAPLLANTTLPNLYTQVNQSGGITGILEVFGSLPVADVVEAAIIALQFLFEGTGPHITYESTDATPGVNHIAHAIGHVNVCCAAVTPRAAA
jgi:hypothetical protein